MVELDTGGTTSTNPADESAKYRAKSFQDAVEKSDDFGEFMTYWWYNPWIVFWWFTIEF